MYVKRKYNKTEEVSSLSQVLEHRKIKTYGSITEPSEEKNCLQSNFFIERN